MEIIKELCTQFSLNEKFVENTVKLIDDGNTIPFIARYRKEMTGGMDDQLLRSLYERLNYLRNLDAERQKIVDTITQQGAMTDELLQKIQSAATLTELEDLYRPYRPKRKTRASVAREKGLEPLAQLYLQQNSKTDIEKTAEAYISDDVPTVLDAINGAKDIIAEIISDNAELRKRIRTVCFAHAKLHSTLKNSEEPGVYGVYGDFAEPVKTIASHRILAINRGEKEDFLQVALDFDKSYAQNILHKMFITGTCPASDLVYDAALDAYDRLIFPAVNREIRNELTQRASEAAIHVFGLNLKQLLLQPPVKDKVVLGLDPGYRTGCKAAVVDATGKVLATGVIYPAPPHSKIEQAEKSVLQWIKQFNVQVLSIGNGTASHETEVFVSELIEKHKLDVSYMVVSEAGASVYSASKLAAAEFPDYDVSLRSAVSIARRLQDPLAELVKIDPKSIGVGQYQHDMPQAQLSASLDGTVEDCVNSVGVDINTASAPLLERVSGITSAVAKNIVAYREENGGFTSRAELKKVQKLGPKAFEQCAGFLRIPGAKNIFDNTAVHPESYAAAKALQQLLYGNKTPKDFTDIETLADTRGMDVLANTLQIGLPTLKDILSELKRPGRDPRDELPPPMLKKEILDMEHLKPGMQLKGTVRNVVDFGVFVDIGVHQDGLVHISKITKRFIKHPSEILKVGDIITVWVLSVDAKTKRISLTMIND